MRKCFVIPIFMLIYSMGFALPKGFVYLNEVSKDIMVDMRYFTDNNFLGRPVNGYYANRCILSKKAALKLKKVALYLKEYGLRLKVYDCYRPMVAVKDFYQWSTNNDNSTRESYYPREKKSRLFRRGYIAAYSGHSRGSTVDLTIVKDSGVFKKGSQLSCYHQNRAQDDSIDMGTNFDCLDVASHYNSYQVSHQARKNRQLLRKVMKQFGFKPYSKEWWHYTLRNEPFPREYFNFDVR